MLSSIQTVSPALGNQAPRGPSVPLSDDAAVSEDRDNASDEFAALIAALMPASPAPVSMALQKEEEAGTPRIAHTNAATLSDPDAAQAELEPANPSVLERVTRTESNLPATGSGSSDGLDFSFAAQTTTHIPGNGVDSGGHDPAPFAPNVLGSGSMDLRRMPLEGSGVGSVVPRPEADQPHWGRQGPGTTARTAASVALELMTETVSEGTAASQIPSLPGGAGEPALHQAAQLGAVEGSVAFRALPTAPAFGAVARASRDASVAKPDIMADKPSALVAPDSVGTAGVLGPNQGVLAAAETAAEPKGKDRGDHPAQAIDIPGPSEPAETARTVPGKMVTDPQWGAALTASPGLGTLTSPQDGAPGGTLPVLPESPGEIVRQNIQQIAEATRHLHRGTIEITLSPEELGHVRLTVKSHDTTGATVVLQADRPETLDLMRRHVDLLAQDMRDFGYRELTFAFQDRRPGDREAPAVGRDTDDSAGDSSAPGKVPGGTMTAASRPSIQDGRLDIRI